MNTLKKLNLGVAFIVIATLFGGCDKDDSPSGIPTAPTEFSPKDGEIIPGNTVIFKVSGSSAENGKNVYYDIYLGTNPEELALRSWVAENLLPGTQYFWQARPYTTLNGGEVFGELSPVFSFYTLPDALEGLESDNGEEETQVILRWAKPDNCKKVEITFSPASNNVAQPIVVPEGQDSIAIDGLLDYDIFTQSFIRYAFTVTASVQVGDKEMERVAQIDEIPLNKSQNVRDIDYNVYTCLRIGNQIWLRENLRTTTLSDGRALLEGEHYVVGSKSDLYGLYYNYEILSDDLLGRVWSPRGNTSIAPEGFRAAMWDDWMQLFKSMGATDEELELHLYDWQEEYIGDVVEIGALMKSRSGWPAVDGIDGNGIDFYTLSVLPGGYINLRMKEEIEVGQKAFLMATSVTREGGSLGAPRVLRFEPTSTGVYKIGLGWMTNIRCVKDIE